MGAEPRHIVAGFVSIALVMATATPVSAAPVRSPATRTAAVPPPAPPPAQMVQASVPAPPPPGETPKQRKEREKAEAKASRDRRNAAEHAAREEDKRLHPERHQGGKKLLACAGGAALGIVAALLLRGRNHHGAGDVVVGAIGGCAAGWALGGGLKGNDSQQMDAYIAQDVALRDDSVRSWKAPNSGQTILLRQADAGYKAIQAEFTIAPDVEAPQPGVVIVARAMRATTALRLRSAPDVTANANIVGTFAPNEIVQVIAETADRKWALIGENNIVVGYASTAFLSSSLAIPLEVPIRFAAMKPPPPKAPVHKAGTRPHAAAPPIRQAAAVAPLPPRKAVVLASSSCKAVTASFGSNSQTQQRCAQSNGTWSGGVA